MDFRFSQTQEAFRKQLTDFLRRELPSQWKDSVGMSEDDNWDLTIQIRKKLAKQGWLTMHWPKEYGGQQASPMLSLVFNEEMSYHRAPGRDAFGTRMLGPTLMIYGTEEQKLKFLPPVGRGEVQWCQGYSEPEAGSDLASLSTSAKDEGDHFLVNGSKIWTSLAHRSDWMMLLARTNPEAPKHRGISFLLVDLKSDGITINDIINMAGAHEFNQVFFDNVRVPKSNLVGQKDSGWYVAVTLLDFERSNIDYAAASRRLLDDVCEFLRGSRGSGEGPTKTWVMDLLTQRYIETEVARLMAYRVAWMQSQGLVPNMEASISKVYGSENYQRVTDTAHKILGLYGLLTPKDRWAPLNGQLQHAWRQSFSNTIAAGTSEIQRNIIASRGLGLPRG